MRSDPFGSTRESGACIMCIVCDNSTKERRAIGGVPVLHESDSRVPSLFCQSNLDKKRAEFRRVAQVVAFENLDKMPGRLGSPRHVLERKPLNRPCGARMQNDGRRELGRKSCAHDIE